MDLVPSRTRSRKLEASTSVKDGDSDSRRETTRISSSKIEKRRVTTDSEPPVATMLFKESTSINAAAAITERTCKLL